MKSFIILSLCVAAILAKEYIPRPRKSYEGYKVIEVVPEDEVQMKFIRKLRYNPNVDFWTEPRGVGAPVHIMLSPDIISSMQQRMRQANMHVKVINHNVQEKVDEELRKLRVQNPRDLGKNLDLDQYNRYGDIMSYMEGLLEDCPAGVTCETYSIGNSIYDNELKVFKMSKPGADRKAYYLDATTHAREWITTATILKILNHMVRDYDTDATVQRLVDNYDFYFLPVVNPDGYIYSWDTDRYWRKNLNEEVGDFFCFGVDINRNFDQDWLTEGASDWVCLDIYAGPSPASEPETQAVQNEALDKGSSVLAWITIHSYSNLWLTPYGVTVDGFNCFYSDDYEDLFAVADAAANAVEATYGTSWERGSVCDILYAAAGSTMDYVKANAGVKYTFTPELRGTDFVIDASEIEASFREVFNGVVATVDTIAALETK